MNTAEKIADLERQKQDIDSQIAKLKAEPDWEAYRPALGALYDKNEFCPKLSGTLNRADKQNIRGLIAAMPLMPENQTDDGWIAWEGGECPVEGRGQVRLISGTVLNDQALEGFDWKHSGSSTDIIAYRPAK